jgi:aspartate-semialdehyde dehydrogenase
MRLKNIAIVGATGAVGEVMLELLSERNFPVGELHLLASARSAGTRLPFKDKNLKVEDLAQFDFQKVDIALFSAGGSVSRRRQPPRVAL